MTTVMLTRDRIIAAASAAIIDGGIRSATTREVARRAGLSEGSIYVHFSSKQDLLAAVLRERLMLPAVQSVAAASPSEHPRQVLMTLVSQLLRQFDEAVPLLAALMSDPALGDLVLRDSPAADGLHGIGRVTEYLRGQQQRGAIGGEADPQLLSRLLFAGTFHHAFLTRAFGEEKLRPRGAAFVRGLVDAVLCAAGKPSPRRASATRR